MFQNDTMIISFCFIILYYSCVILTRPTTLGSNLDVIILKAIYMKNRAAECCVTGCAYLTDVFQLCMSRSLFLCEQNTIPW